MMVPATKRTTWTELARERMRSPEAHAGYARARRAYEIGRQVRELRLAHGLSQTQLAQQAKTSQAAIARIESGDVLPTLDSLERISAVLAANLVVRLEPDAVHEST